MAAELRGVATPRGRNDESLNYSWRMLSGASLLAKPHEPGPLSLSSGMLDSVWINPTRVVDGRPMCSPEELCR